MSADLLAEFGGSETYGAHDQVEAYDESIEDEFGDFEEAHDELKKEDTSQAKLESHAQPIDSINVSPPHGDLEWGDFEDGNILFDAEVEETRKDHKHQKESQQRPTGLPPVPPLIQVEVDDDDFDAWEPVPSYTSPTLTTKVIVPQKLQGNSSKPPIAFELSQSSKPSADEPPPANVPPPTVHLSLSANTDIPAVTTPP